MTPTHIWRLGRLEAEKDPARKYIVQALIQAGYLEAPEVVFGATCATCQPVFHWAVEGGHCQYGMPPEVQAFQVRQTLMALAGLDVRGAFPQRSELVLDLENTQASDGEEHTSFARMTWQVSLDGPDSHITLKRRKE